MGEDDRLGEDSWFSVDPKGQREPEVDPGPRRGPSFLSVLLGLVFVAIGVVAWVNHSSADRATPSPSPTTSRTSPTSSPATLGPPTQDPTSAPRATRTTTAGSGPPLGATRPWDLFVVAGETLTRVEMASGRTVQISLPFDSDQAPTSIVDLGDRVLVQPVYNGTGFVVPDSGPVSTATNRYPAAALVLPALGAQRLWSSDPTDEANRLDLLTMDGKRVSGGSLTLPADLFADSARSDGGLAILVDGYDGTYRVEGTSLRRVTTGQLLGRSEGGWLVQECDDDHRCGMFFVDRESGTRRPLGASLVNPLTGSISPDAQRAVVFDNSPNGTSLILVDLQSGARRKIQGYTAGYGPNGATAVWSPDSRWAVAVRDTGEVLAVDTRSARTVAITVSGPVASVAARYR